MASLLLLCLLGLLATGCRAPDTSRLEVFPQHFLLHPGERIHYTVLERSSSGRPRFPTTEFAAEDPDVVRLIGPAGSFEAVAPGRTELVVRTPTSERRIRLEVAGDPRSPIASVPHGSFTEIVAKELLFVGHANLDGWDHTAVAKPGIDRLVQEAKANGWPVVYWVSAEYPDWYTADRHPDYAILSEGQEHEIRFDAERIVFTGGGFMFCLLRNAQMTLHAMAKHGARRAHFVFPAQAIWEPDVWGPGEKRPYPSPMVLLSTLFAGRPDDARAYDELVVPFLDRLLTEFPVLGYPPDPPAPPLSELLEDWSIVVRFGDRYERFYRRGDPDKRLLVDFQGV
jgi:hypothetical protein